MLQTITLIIQGIVFVTYKLSIFIITIFLILRFFSINPINRYQIILNKFLGVILAILYYTLPRLTILLIFPLTSFFIYYQDTTINKHPELVFWKCLLENTKLLIKLYTSVTIPSTQQSITKKIVKITILLSIASALRLIFMPEYQIYTTLLIIYCSLLAFLSRVTLIFYLSLIIPRTKIKTPVLNNRNPESTPQKEFVTFLKSYSSNNSLEATVEELFYEENLQIGNFFLAFPIFYKTNPPEYFKPSPAQELKQIWHTIRWESTFSKQIGSGTDWWTLENPQNKTNPPDRVHSIHIPIIPVYSDKLFQALKEQNFPTFNPFDLKTKWTPYQILTSRNLRNLAKIKEERPNEIEEED